MKRAKKVSSETSVEGNTRHTPGPWKIFDRGDGETYSVYQIEVSDGVNRSVLAQIQPNWVCEEHGDALAIAHLIAAAPELLAVLKEHCDTLEEGIITEIRPGSTFHLKMREVIAKAEGKANAL
jgi:hypothetical protein